MTVTRLVRSGVLERLSRGIYRHEDSPISSYQDMLLAAAQSPKAIIMLISALRYHELGTQAAYEVWMQLPQAVRKPSSAYPTKRIVYTTISALLIEGVKQYEIDGRIVPITTPSRTITDCFKHRNLIGLEPCIEALKDLLKKDHNCMEEIRYFAKINRVQNVMRPYLEAIV